MKKIFTGTPHTKFIAAVSALTWTIAMANSAGAAQLQEARVTQVVNDVKLLLEQSAPRPAAISDLVRRGNAVRTGPQSRSELTFADLTITRLGANTIFSFKEGTREMNLIDGAILFQVPKGSGGATIRTVGVTAAITGTTGIAEFHPATTSHPQLSKWLCLEGTFHLYLPNGQSVELGPGKIVTSDGKSFSKVSTFDIAKLVSTSLFFTGFDQPLASMNLIMLESENQLASSLFATSTTNPLDPARIVNVTSQAIAAEETPTSPAASPTPPITPTPPSKFGTPSVISSPVPYLITNGTVITTDPSITTNSVTDYGKIYRGQTDDGAFSLWAFGSTSAFDTALRIDNIFFADPSHLPVAVFKFESLSLTGDPTIDTSNGVPKLALIGVDGITSGPPGGTLKFTGLDLLLLATVNGSINLTSDVSFQDLHELVMYARGAGSDLTINSPISNIGILGLVAEDSIHLTNPGTMSVGKIEMAAGSDLMLQIGGSLLLNGSMRLDAIVLPGASVASGVNLTLNVTGDYRNNSATASSQLIITNRDHIGGDARIAVGATNIFTANNLDVQIDNRVGGHIGENALVNVGVSGGDINIVGDATFQILNNFRGHIGRDANIFVTTGAGGDFTANSILALVNNHNGGAIGSGAELTFNIGGALVTQGDATFVISNLNEGPGGGTIGSLASLNMNAASISVGGFFQTFVGANGGGSIQGDAINTVNVSGDLTAQQGILVDIQDTGFNQINPTVFIAGGHIGGDATVTLAAQNIATSSTATGVPGIDTMALEASIYSDGSGTIGGNAIVNVLASQNISAPGTVFFGVANDNYQGFGGGTIGGDAQVNVTAGSLSTGALFDNIYNNGGGSIGRDAIISLNLSNGFTATGNAEFAIFNPGGIVGRNASIAVNAGRMSAPSLSAEIDNSNGGNIGGNALINFDVSGDLTTQDDTTFQILNGAGTIGGNVEISLTAANITATSLLAQINNSNGGTIGGTAAINVSTTSANSLSANIDNSIGGTIGASANISLATGGDFATSVGDATFTINNTAGTITNNANLALNAGGSVSTAGELSLLLENYDESANPAGHIGGSANVSLITGENLTADFANIAINNRGGGRIDSGATLTIDIAGALTTLHNGLDFLGNPASLSLAVSNRGDNNTAGSFIGGDATLLFHSNSASIGGDLSVVISDKGGTIDGNALLNFSVTHDLTVQGESAATWQILTGDGPDVFGSPIGGTIHGNATLQVSAADLTVPAGSLDIEILNQNTGVSGPGGTIDSSANITFNLSGNLTTQADASFAIRNNYTASGPGGIGGIGGTIGQDAVLNINANSLSIGGTLDTSIHNGRNAGDNGGTIGGNATINLVVVGGITALDDSQFIGNGGGTIGSNAAITVSAASLATTDTTPGALSASINNSAGGSIGGSASINFDLSGNLTSASDTNFLIDNSNGGTISSDATINVSAANITPNSLVAHIDNSNGGTIGGAANVAINVDKDVTTLNGIDLQILNGNSGHIVTGADILYSVGGTTSTTDLTEYIDNSNGGAIDNGGNVILHTVGPMMLDGGLQLEMDNFNGGRINNGADVMAHFAGDVTATIGDFHSFNFFVVNGGNDFFGNLGGGTIGTGGNIEATFDGNAATTPTATSGSFAAEIANDHGNIGTGGNISVTIGGNVICSGLFVYTSNRYGGHIGTGGNVAFDVAGDVTGADQAFFAVLNNGGTIGSGTSLTVSVGGDLTTQTGAFFQILNNDGGNGSGPGTIGGDATISVSAANISTGGALNATSDNTSGSIGGNANLNFNLTGDLATQGNASFVIDNNNSGFIGSDATINVAASSISVGGGLDADIFSPGGNISGSALLSIAISGDIATQGDVTFSIFNNDQGDGAGTIGSDATINVGGANISTGGALNGNIYNTGGTIGGNAAINLTATNISVGTALAPADLDFGVDNTSGSIGGSVATNLNVSGDITVAGAINAFLNNGGATSTPVGHITGDATIDVLGATGINAGNGAFFGIVNEDAGAGTFGGTIDGNALLSVTADHLSTEALAPGDFNLFGTIHNRGGTIGGNSDVMFDIAGAITTAGRANFDILNFDDGGVNGGGIIGGNAMVSVSANSLTTTTTQGDAGLSILNGSLGSIGGSAMVSLNLTGDLTAQGVANFAIGNSNGGTIGGTANGDAAINMNANNISTGGAFDATIDNSIGGTVGGSANLNFNVTGNLTSQGDANFQILNNDGGQIGGNGNISVTTGGDFTANSVFAFVNNRNGGAIGSAADMNFNIGGTLSTSGDATFVISNRNDGSGGGTIGGNVSLTLDAASISGGGILVTDVSTNQGGHIMGSVHNTVDAAGLLSGGTLDFEIENAGFDTGGGFEPGGTIDADAILSVTASDISTTSDYFNAIITNDGGGHIGGNATVSVVASSMDVATNAFFNILNGQNGAGTPTGSIGGNAAIDVAAATLSIGGNLDSGIDNSGGSISGMAQIIFNLAGNLTTQSDALFVINNSSIDGGISTGTIGSDATIDLSANNISTGGSLSAAIDNSSGLGNGAIGGTIGGDATVNITATNLTANSLLAQINNTNGSIGASTEGGAVINMNVSGTATVTNDATVQILGSDGAVGGAGININGGSYNVGGTFLSYIDGNGTIAFNNINAHADVLKAGVFGTNGVLNVGGGILEANTTLKLYASGSNGVLNFLNSVTLRGSALTKILAANTINIFDNVRVTIGGSTPADVYTNHANYTGFGGNGTRTGTFAGAGAHDPQPLASAPPFGPASPVKLTIGGNIPSATAVPPQSAPGRTPAPGGNITSRTRIPPTLPSNVLTNGKIADVRRASNVINVRSSDELLSLLDDAAPGPGGKITIPPAKSTNHSKNSNRTNVPGRVNTGSRVNVDRRAVDMRTASSSVIRHSPQ